MWILLWRTGFTGGFPDENVFHTSILTRAHNLIERLLFSQNKAVRKKLNEPDKLEVIEPVEREEVSGLNPILKVVSVYSSNVQMK